MIIVGGIIGLVYWNIQKDDEELNKTYDIQPDAGKDMVGSVGMEITFNGKNRADEQDYPDVIYQWDFDDDEVIDWESKVLFETSHSYTKAREYVARFIITVVDGDREISKEDTLLVTVDNNNGPVAKFTVSSQNVHVGETVQFSAIQSTDVEDGNDLEFSWDFDNDGLEDSTDREAFFSYSYPDEYLVMLEITDSGGKSDTESTTIYVTEEETPDKREIELEGGGEGSIGPNNPNNPFSDSEFILNWDMTDEFMEGLKKVELILTWEDLTWDLDVSFGKGDNSGSGVEYDKDEGGSEGGGEGNVTIDTDDEDHLSYDSEEQWFVEVTTKEATKTAGGTKSINDECSFSVSVILWYV